jgi:hypothetical protein
VINTDIDRNLNPVMRFGFGVLVSLNGKSVEEGAATTCYVATSSKLGNISGRYFEDCDAVTIENEGHMQNMAMAERLLQTSIELTSDWLVEFKEPTKQDFE